MRDMKHERRVAIQVLRPADLTQDSCSLRPPRLNPLPQQTRTQLPYLITEDGNRHQGIKPSQINRMGLS